MDPIPLPSHVHYELLLQLLERQTMFVVGQKPGVQEQVHQLIITLRKALAQQKQLEENCQRYNLPIEYRWSLNKSGVGSSAPGTLESATLDGSKDVPSDPTDDFLRLRKE